MGGWGQKILEWRDVSREK